MKENCFLPILLSLLFVLSLCLLSAATVECPTKLTYHAHSHHVSIHDQVKHIPSAMSHIERTLLLSHVANSTVYYEFGGGGSTVMACEVGKMKQIIVVDGSLDFLAELVHNSTCLRNNPKVISHYIDIGPVREWTIPTDPSTSWRWRDYPESIYHFAKLKPDVVLIDGRFRIACVLTTLLALGETGVTMLVHDFSTRYHIYGVVLEFVKMVDYVERLVVLKPILPLNRTRISMELEKYVLKYD